MVDDFFSNSEIEDMVVRGACYYQVDGIKVPVLPPDQNLIYDICDVVNVIYGIVSGKDFSNKSGGEWKLNKRGEKLLECLDSVDTYALSRALSGGCGHPYIFAFNDVRRIVAGSDGLQNSAHWRRAENINSAIDVIRKELDKAIGLGQLKEKARNIVRGVRKSIEGLTLLVGNALRDEPDICVVSVALRYACVPALKLDGRVSSSQAKTHLFDFIREVERRARKDLRGHIWKLEFGLSGRYCSRIIFFVRADRLPEFERVLERGTAQWKKTSASDYVVYADWDAPTFNMKVEGGVDAVSGELRSWLIDTIYLFFKADIFLRPDLPGRDRVFGRSGIFFKSATS